jgi:hypothetical protein
LNNEQIVKDREWLAARFRDTYGVAMQGAFNRGWYLGIAVNCLMCAIWILVVCDGPRGAAMGPAVVGIYALARAVYLEVQLRRRFHARMARSE